MNKQQAQVLISILVLGLCLGGVIGWAAIPDNTLSHGHGAAFPTFNATGAGYFIGPNNVISATRAAQFVTLDTGQGANELYPMDQAVRTTDSVAFSNVTSDEYWVGTWNATGAMRYPVTEASYVVWSDGLTPSTYYAKNGMTGQITSGTDPDVFINALLAGVDPYSVIAFDRTQQITINSYINVVVAGTVIDGLNYYLADNSNTHGILVAAENVTIRNCIGDGNKANQVTANRYGIYGGGAAHGLLVENCITHDWHDIGIRVDGDRSLVTHCTSHDNGRDGIAGDIGVGITLSDNICYGNVNLEIGIGLAAKDVTISNNYLFGGTGLWGSIFVGGGCDRVNVIGNIIDGDGTALYGIGLGTQDKALNVNVIGNYVYNVTNACMRVTRADTDKISIKSNYLHNGVYGVYCDLASNVQIENNYIYSCTTGIGTNTGEIIGNHIKTMSLYGIYVTATGLHVKISNNYIELTDQAGIAYTGSYGEISHNTIINGNQDNLVTNRNGSGILLDGTSTYNEVFNNIIRSTIAPLMCYGIYENTNANYNRILNNAIHGVTTIFTQLGGANTKFASKTFQFTEPIVGAIATTSPTGVDVDAATEGALAWGQLPVEIQQVVRIKVWAVSTGTPIGAGGQMHLSATLNAGAANAAYNTATKSWAITDFDGADADYAANDAVSWVIVDASVGNELRNLTAGDSFEFFALYNAGADPDGATDAVFRCIEIEYV